MHQKVLEHVVAEGYPISEIISDSEIHRFRLDDGDTKRSGWYVCHRNYLVDKGKEYVFIIFGDWKSEQKKHFSSLEKGELTPSQALIHKKQIKAAQEKSAALKEVSYAEAAKEAQTFWDSCSSEGSSEYLSRKQISTIQGIRYSGDKIYIPIRDCSRELLSLEQISADGSKLSWTGARKQGGYFTFGNEKSDRAYIAEGFATAASIHLATGEMAICTFGLGNLKTVAQLLKKKLPQKIIVICGDRNSSERSESEKLAEKAAKEISCAIVFPIFQSLEGCPTDFNDLHCREGLDQVKEQLLTPNALAPIELTGAEIVTSRFPDEDDNGKRKGTIENLKELLRRLNIQVRYNGISKRQEILIPNLSTTIDNETNSNLAAITSWCERCGIPTRNLASYLGALADQNLYNPVKSWIESESWDGISRLSEFYATLHAPQTKMKDKLILTWLLSAVAAAYEPNGVSAHGVLVLQGAQYMGKTKWFKNLAPADLVADGMLLRPESKDSVSQIISKWLVELGELDATFRKSDISQLKAFITKDRDVIRRPYAQADSYYPRRTVFFGSVNEKTYLNDPTGNRRFWTIECESINHEHSVNMQQLWAEVHQLYLQGEKWILSNEDVLALNTHNEKFETIEPIEELIRSNFNWGDSRRDWVNTTILCREIGIQNPTTRDIRVAAKVIQKVSGLPGRMSNGKNLYAVAPAYATAQLRSLSLP